MTHTVSALLLLLLIIGRSARVRRKRKLHSIWMTLVVAGDLTMIGYLVLGPRVLDKVTPDMSSYLSVHITFAIALVVCYALALQVGWILYARPSAILQRRMRTLDRVIVPLRVAVFATSLML